MFLLKTKLVFPAFVLFFCLNTIQGAVVTSAKIYLDQGVSLFKQEKYFEAVDSLRNAIEINPYYGDAYKYLAEINFTMGDYTISLDNALTALKYANNDADALLIVANAYRELGNFNKSESYYQDIMKKYPSNVEVYRNLAELYMKMNKLPLAFTMLSKADRIKRDYWRNYISFGNYHLKKGNLDKAEDYLRRAYNLNPTERQVYVSLAEFYKSIGSYDAAISLIESGEKLFENFYSGILILSECYLLNAQNDPRYYPKAIEKLNWVIQSSVKKQNAFKAWLYYKLGFAEETIDKDKAVSSYRQALALSSGNDFIRYTFESFTIKNFKIDSPLRRELSDYHYAQANEAYRRGELRLYYFHLKRAITLAPLQIEPREKLIAYFESRKDNLNAYQELRSLEKINSSTKVKDRLEIYDWKLKNKKISFVKKEDYAFQGVFLVDADFFNFPRVYSEVFMYNSQYYDKFKFSSLEFRKRQGINYILETLRQNDYTYFVIAALSDDQNNMKFTLYDKTGKVLEELLVNFSIEKVQDSINRCLAWLNKVFPEVWIIGDELAVNSYNLSAGRMDGIAQQELLTAFNIGFAGLETLSFLQVTNSGDYTSAVKVLSNVKPVNYSTLTGKYAVRNESLTPKYLTKFKRLLGY